MCIEIFYFDIIYQQDKRNGRVDFFSRNYAKLQCKDKGDIVKVIQKKIQLVETTRYWLIAELSGNSETSKIIYKLNNVQNLPDVVWQTYQQCYYKCLLYPIIQCNGGTK